ncbi:hypothetical protein [uncultured Rubinisphaera sp.]|uniref:hypothetical protein n=1 Tax=uncultured Rubinisphaera sp. TaxID=1678686 RepID=UPI0030D9FD6E
MVDFQCGEIRQDASYSLDEFRKRTGLKHAALRTARSNGLNVIYRHNRAYVLGEDWLKYLKSQSENPERASA